MQPTEMSFNLFINGTQADQELRKILEKYPSSLSYSGKITIQQNQEDSGSPENGDRSIMGKGPTSPVPKQSVTLYCCYAKEDEAGWKELHTHLAPLRHVGKVVVLDNHNILPGDDTSADILLLLISCFFLDQCWNLMERAMTRHHQRTLRVVPVWLSPVLYNETMPIYGLQRLPSDGKPIHHSDRSRPDEAYTDVVEGVYKVIEVLLKERNNDQESK